MAYSLLENQLDDSCDYLNNDLKALIIDGSELDNAILKKILAGFSYQVSVVKSDEATKNLLLEYQPDIVFINLTLFDHVVHELTKFIKTNLEHKYAHVIYITAIDDKAILEKCLDAGGDDFIVKPINDSLLTVRVDSILRTKKLYDNLLDKKLALSEHIRNQEKDLNDARSIINNMQMPRFVNSGNMDWAYIAENILSGDILCSAINPSGEQIILVGDNTGHGLPAAIGSMITCETFYSMVSKGFDMQVIIEEINKKLFYLFPVDRFFAACIMSFNSEYDEMQIWNSGFPGVLVVNEGGQLKEKISSMDMALGIKLISENEIIPVRVDLRQGDFIYAFTDGVFELFNSEGEMYGEERLLKSIESNHNKKNKVDKIVNDAMQFQGHDKLNDDLLLLEVSCDKKLIVDNKKKSINDNKIKPMEWESRFEFGKM